MHKYYKDPKNNQVYAYLLDKTEDSYILPQLVNITEKEADELRWPTLSANQIKDQIINEFKYFRPSILSILDGYQTSMLVTGNSEYANLIELVKQELRDITNLEIGKAKTEKDIIIIFKDKLNNIKNRLVIGKSAFNNIPESWK